MRVTPIIKLIVTAYTSPQLHGTGSQALAERVLVHPAGRQFGLLEGWRRVGVTDRRTKVDWAHQVKELVDEDYPDKDRIVLVMDNLNTRHPASLYEAFEPMEARHIAERLEFHYTPKHGSWLNMAEIEFSVLSRCCLKQRVPHEPALRREVQALVTERNIARSTIDWQFNTQDARTKLHSLYPFDS